MTTTDVVYRLEDPHSGHGPHTATEFPRISLYTSQYTLYPPSTTNPYDHPTPQDDGLDMPYLYTDLLCGCDSYEGLLWWWGDHLAPLVIGGFDLVRYTLARPHPVGRRSHTQTIFTLTDTTNKEVLS